MKKLLTIGSLIATMVIFPNSSNASVEKDTANLIDEYELDELLEENEENKGDYFEYGATSTFSVKTKEKI